MSNWPYISYLGVHLIKWQLDPTSSSNQISTWLDLKPHLGEHIWPNVNLILHLIWPNVKLALYLIFGGTSDQMTTWPCIFIWPNIDLTWLIASYWGTHLTKCHPDSTSNLTKCQSCPTSHCGGDIWSNVNRTLHLHLTKYQSVLTQSLILEDTSDQMSNWLSVSSLGVHLPKCQPDHTSDLTICQSGPTSHLQEYIWSNVNLILHLIWPNVKLALYLIFGGTSDQMLTWPYISSDQMSKWSYLSSSGVHLIKCQPDPTSSSNQISTWLDLKPHFGEHILPNVILTLHLIWPNFKVVLHLIFRSTSDQMSTWLYISSDQMSKLSYISS